MTVFRGFLKIVKRNAPISVLYLVIFLAISVIAQMQSAKETTSMFEQTELTVGIIDEDHSEISEGLTKYLNIFHTIKDLPNDKSKLQDIMFYRDVDYIVTIPEGFDPETMVLNVTQIPGTTSAYYVDGQINDFLNGYTVLVKSGYSPGEAAQLLIDSAETPANVEVLESEDKRSEWEGYAYLFQYMPYVIISITAYTLGTVMIDFYRPILRRRTRVSPISSMRMNGEYFLGYGLFGIVVWAVFSALPFVMYGSKLLNDSNVGYYLLNNLMIVLVSLAATSLIGLLLRKLELLSAIVNVLALGMSFLCGVFIPLELLDKNVRIFSKFLPVYWFEEANAAIAGTKILSGESLKTVLECYGMQLLFAAALLSVTLIVGKLREQEKSVGSVVAR